MYVANSVIVTNVARTLCNQSMSVGEDSTMPLETLHDLWK